MSNLLASLMRNYFPKRPSGAPLHTLSKLYDVPVSFVTPPPLYWGYILLYLQSPKGGCCSISDDLSCSYTKMYWNQGKKLLCLNFVILNWSSAGFISGIYFSATFYFDKIMWQWCVYSCWQSTKAANLVFLSARMQIFGRGPWDLTSWQSSLNSAQRMGRPFCFSDRHEKNTNLVEDVCWGHKSQMFKTHKNTILILQNKY